MNAEELIMISVDEHVVEPPDMFNGHIPANYANAAPPIGIELGKLAATATATA